MKPTVGRIVHLNHGGRRVPAIVIFIDDETGAPSLRALDGSEVVRHHAEHADESEESARKLNYMDTPSGTWSWPPKG